MSFKETYPDFAVVEEHIRRARIERSVAIAHAIVQFVTESGRGLKKLARSVAGKHAETLPTWAGHAPELRRIRIEN